MLAFVASMLAVAFSATVAPPANAAPGDPFDPTEPQQFVIVGTANSQLYRTVTASDGTLTLQEIGAPAPVGYNGIGYNTADNYIYGTVTSGNAEFPTGSIVRVDATGTLTRVGTGSDWPYPAGTIGPDGLMTVGSSVTDVWPKVDPTTGAQVGTLTLSQPLSSFPGVTASGNDIAYADGFFWTSASSHIFRINAATGQVDAFPSPVPPELTGEAGSGAAFTYGNGNLGFVYNATGTVVQVSVTDPGSASPVFEFISSADGPANGNNDATSSPGLPADLEIVKAGPAWYVAGGQVSYTLTVTNNGLGVSSGQTITDTLPDGLTNITPPTGCTVNDRTVTCVNGRLAIGASVEYTLTASAPNPATTCLTNLATVLGNETDSDSSNNESSVTSCPTLPAIDLVKTTDATELNAGETITYTFTATNTGNTPLTDVAIDETSFSGSGSMSALDCTPTQPTTLAVDEQLTCTATYTVTQADVDSGSILNTASATSTDPLGAVVTDKDSVTVPADPAPAYTLEKSASMTDVNGNDLTDPGDEIKYSFKIVNTGNVTLTDVGVEDPLLADAGITITCDPTTLAPGKSVTCVADAAYVITQADIDSGAVHNTATGTAVAPPGSPEPEDPTDEIVTPIEQTAAYTLDKKAASVTDVNGNGVTDEGDTIGYEFKVTNTGNVTVTNVAIDDPKLAKNGITTSCDPTTLAPGESVVCTADSLYEVTAADVARGKVHNVATATADVPPGVDSPSDPVKDTSDHRTGTNPEPVPPVIPAGDLPNTPAGDLPDTGAAEGIWLWIAAGVLLLAAGSVVLLGGRRRQRRPRA